MSARRVLVTGAAGFVGANLVRRMLGHGHRVWALFRAGDHWRLADVGEHVERLPVDLSDADATLRAVQTVRPDWILHAAAFGGYSWQTDALAILRANVIGTANLLSAALATGFEAFVNTGSSSEYGLRSGPSAETDACDPNSHYAVSKLCATQLCRQTARSEGLALCTLRLYSVYGPWEEPRRLMPALVVHGLEKRLPVLANPDTARDFVHVDDVLDAYELALSVRSEEPGAIYNIGTGVQTTLREAVDAAREVLGIAAEPRWGTLPSRSWDTASWVGDVRRAERVLGWSSRIDLRAGLARFAQWLRERPEVLERYRRDLLE